MPREEMMHSESRERHHLFTGLKTDIVTKDDGRYIIYYEWPGKARVAGAEERRAAPEPRAEAWSPETRPADV